MVLVFAGNRLKQAREKEGRGREEHSAWIWFEFSSLFQRTHRSVNLSRTCYLPYTEAPLLYVCVVCFGLGGGSGVEGVMLRRVYNK